MISTTFDPRLDAWGSYKVLSPSEFCGLDGILLPASRLESDELGSALRFLLKSF
jgi:hypothetical protein